MISPETTSAGQFLRPELPEEALYGLPGDVIGALAPTTEADPAALLLTFMTMFGNVIGAEPHVAFGGADHPGRLFVLIAGDAATGRKGTSLSVIEKLGRPGIWLDHRRPVGRTARQGHSRPSVPRVRKITLNAWYAARILADRDMLIVDPGHMGHRPPQ